jgi:choline dehydrogenase-like flavoprotein
VNNFCIESQGVDGLRIADASVFPWIPSAPIAATAMAVGVNAARLILRTHSTSSMNANKQHNT